MLHLVTGQLTCWKTVSVWLMSTTVGRHLLYKHTEWHVPCSLLLLFSLDSLPQWLLLANNPSTHCTVLQTEWLVSDQWANLREKTSPFLLQLPFCASALSSLCIQKKILVVRSYQLPGQVVTIRHQTSSQPPSMFHFTLDSEKLLFECCFYGVMLKFCNMTL